MIIEVLIATMHRNNNDLFNSMQIKTNGLIINQTDKNETIEYEFEGHHRRMISCDARGVSKSRNLALRNSKADICVIADDDLKYVHDYEQIILTAYKENPNADIIAFDVPSENPERPTNRLDKKEVGYLNSMKLASFQVSLRRESLINNNITFNELFGAGSHFTCGEENILMYEAIKKGLKVLYIDTPIATVNHDESTWYSGFDKKLFLTKGAMFYVMTRIFYIPFILQFAIRKRSMYKKDFSLFKAIRLMFEGVKEYKQLNR